MHLLMGNGANQSLIGLAPRGLQRERPHLADDTLQHGITPKVSQGLRRAEAHRKTSFGKVSVIQGT
jgi:hypothetical protein